MTQRFQYDTYWASGGVATDPDLDTTHPIYVADRYETQGWTKEKPPNEWDNFLYQITDAKIIDVLNQGMAVWDGSVEYSDGALVYMAGKLYKNIKGSSTVVGDKAPPLAPTIWQPVLELDAVSFQALVAALAKQLSDHLAADNPHNDDIVSMGGILSTTVFTALDDDADPRTIKYHTKQTGKVHSETPKQVGTLPAATVSGEDTFTGDVTFLSSLFFNTGKTAYVRVNKATARAELSIGGATLAVDSGGRVYYTSGGIDYLVVTVANFNEIQVKINYLFTLPVPLANADVTSGSLSFFGCSPTALSTSSEPVWEGGKGLTLAGAGLAATGMSFPSVNTTAYIIGCNAKGVQTEFYDSSTSNFNDLDTFLQTTCVSKFTHLQSITIYLRLTAYQKATLVKYVTA